MWSAGDGGGGTRRSGAPAAEDRRNWPELAFPWPIQAAVWRWSRPVARANHPGGLRGSAMGVVVRTAKRGGSVAARFIGVRCADFGSGLRARTKSAKERVGCCDAHRA